ncbi:mechanosensitive ion channel domain-containing protein [Microcoleus sp. AT3-D2]|uniref:mechanosensitive ion channel domain-containing protein n=1 Tax=Microcoleus sp. AT3-D2 TaxID=2818612 RepID=UPI002FCED8EA
MESPAQPESNIPVRRSISIFCVSVAFFNYLTESIQDTSPRIYPWGQGFNRKSKIENRKSIDTLTWAAGSLSACVIAFPAWRPADMISWLGLCSVGICFAFQDIFKYFLAEILLLLHESFQWGDRIIVEGFEGTVEKILRRSTQIIIDRGERVIMPKAIVFTNSVRAS